jgi:hypothetical protein
MHKHRTNVVNEILATEVHYVNSIKQIVEVSVNTALSF